MIDELKFTTKEVFTSSQRAVYPGITDSVDALTEGLNCILEKKLEKAMTIYGDAEAGLFWNRSGPGLTDTHRGKAVCLEQLELPLGEEPRDDYNAQDED